MDEFRRFGFENPDLEFSHGGSNFNPSSDGVAVTANTETEQLPVLPDGYQATSDVPLFVFIHEDEIEGSQAGTE